MIYNKQKSKITFFSKPTEKGIDTFLEYVRELSRLNNHEYVDMLDVLQHMGLTINHEKVQWHRMSYGKFTNPDHIKRLRLKLTAAENNTSGNENDECKPDVKIKLQI